MGPGGAGGGEGRDPHLEGGRRGGMKGRGEGLYWAAGARGCRGSRWFQAAGRPCSTVYIITSVSFRGRESTVKYSSVPHHQCVIQKLSTV